MIEIKLDEKIFERGSHIEIRKRKDEIVILEVPKAKQLENIGMVKE